MILFVNRFFHPDRSATSQILSDAAFHLASRGERVLVVAGRLRYDDPRVVLPGHERIDGVEVRRVWSTRFGRGGFVGRAVDLATFWLSAALTLLWLVPRHATVVAMTDPPLLSISCAVACRLRGARLVNWLQDLYPEVGSALGMRTLQGPLGDVLRRARNVSLARARTNIVIGEAMAEHLRRQGIAADTIAVVPNWADDRAIRPVARESNPLRARWCLEGRFVVGYSGNLGRAHDWATLAAAADLLRDEDDIVFLFIGGGAHEGQLRKVAATLPPGRFRFEPYQDRGDLALTLGVADVHWISLRPELEGLIVPSKLYGVAAAGRAIVFIGDPGGEVARQLDRWGCGLTVRQGDAASLAEHLKRLAASPEECAELGRRARVMIDTEGSQASRLEELHRVLAPPR